MKLRNVLAAIVFASLAACAQMGLEKPQSFDDQLAYAYSTHTGIAQTLQMLDSRGAVNRIDYANAYHALDLSATMLSEAKFAETTGDMSLASSKLAAVDSILVGLTAIMEQRKAGK